MAFHRFISAALHRQEVEIYGSGEQRRDFTYVGDVVRANVLATQRSLPPGTVINIAGGSFATVNMVLKHIAELVGDEVRVRHVAQKVGDVEETRADCSVSRLLLGWSPTVELSEGLAHQVRWQSTVDAPALAATVPLPNSALLKAGT